jgi:hypothetical protein
MLRNDNHSEETRDKEMFFLIGFWESMAQRHLDFGLLASRTMRQ